jgi:hypothetical protein
MTQLTVAFYDFANAPKNVELYFLSPILRHGVVKNIPFIESVKSRMHSLSTLTVLNCKPKLEMLEKILFSACFRTFRILEALLDALTSFVFQLAIKKYKDKEIRNYNHAGCFVCV